MGHKYFWYLVVITFVFPLIILFRDLGWILIPFRLFPLFYTLVGIVIIWALILYGSVILIGIRELWHNVSRTKKVNAVPIKKWSLYRIFLVSFSYMLVFIPIILSETRLHYISYEWLFAYFVLFAGFCFFNRIDARFVILPALFLLLLTPVLLAYDFDLIAESTAIYAYYFLVVGVLLQLIEFYFKRKIVIDFALLKSVLRYRIYLYPAIIFAVLFFVIENIVFDIVSSYISLCSWILFFVSVGSYDKKRSKR